MFNTKRIIILVVCLLGMMVLAAAGGGLYFRYWLTQPLAIGDGTIVVVDKGQTFSGMVHKLVAEEVIAEPYLFTAYGRATGMDRLLKAGEYSIPQGTTHAQLMDIISSGYNIVQHTVSLIEGRTLQENLSQWRDDNSRLKPMTPERQQQEINSLLSLDAPSPEGLFFADTYYFEAGNTELDILRRAHDRLMEVLQQEWDNRQPNLPYKTPYEALILASMIERETGVPEERGVIAGVFVRRLQQKMRLQSDPTVIYGMGDKYEGRIGRADLRRKTDWNTYTIPALPITPISLVGRDAIHAALNPVDGDELYFVARGDGSHVFSATLSEHNQAVRRYQLNRRADYRSTPVRAGVVDKQQ